MASELIERMMMHEEDIIETKIRLNNIMKDSNIVLESLFMMRVMKDKKMKQNSKQDRKKAIKREYKRHYRDENKESIQTTHNTEKKTTRPSLRNEELIAKRTRQQ